MTKIIDSSFKDCLLKTGLGFTGVKIKISIGWKTIKYTQKQFAKVEEIDSDVFRSAGKAAVGTIVGGALLGGVGLIAGAAMGGKRRKTANYLIHFDDGEYIAFHEKDKTVIKHLDQILLKKKVQKRLVDDH